MRVDAGPLLREIHLAGEVINASTALHEARMNRNDRAKLKKEHSLILKLYNTSGVIATSTQQSTTYSMPATSYKLGPAGALAPVLA